MGGSGPGASVLLKSRAESSVEEGGRNNLGDPRVDRTNLIGFLIVAVVLGGVLGGMAYMSDRLAGDWHRVEDCAESYWTCTAVVGGLPRTGGSNLIKHDRLARSCRENGAWERSVRRASFDCSMSRRVTGGTCRVVEVECELPDKLY